MTEDEFEDLLILDIDTEIEAMEAELEAMANRRQYADEDPALQELDEDAYIREFQIECWNWRNSGVEDCRQ